MPKRIWEVIGGQESGGILVRCGLELGSKPEAERLSFGALVEELSRTASGRMKYRRLTGRGPEAGWVSMTWKDRPLLMRGRLSIARLLMKPDPTRDLSKSYEIDDTILGSGSFASVFRAKHRITAEERAVKRILRKLHAKINTDEAVETELKLLVTLDHPNIMKFYEYFVEETAFYLVTEFCSEGTFTQLEPEASDICGMEDARLLFRDVMSAVAYCHELGVVHRDLKCDNCLIVNGANRRQAKVIDFGVSAIRKHGDTSGEWLHELTGTPFYRAPEVLDDHVPYGTKADLWSIGVMLYVTFTKEHPFWNMATNETLQVLKHVPREPLEHAELPEALTDLILRLLVEDQSARLDATSAMQHDWLKPMFPGWRQASPTSGDAAARRRRRRVCNLRGACHFRALAQFERALLTLVAHHAHEQEVADLRCHFRRLDEDGNGSISKEELKAGIAAGDLSISKQDFNEIFATIDTGGNGQIEYTEWLAATVSPSTLGSDDAVKDVFCFLDHSDTGEISKDDLRVLLGEDLAENVLSEGDTSGDQVLDLEEFRGVLRNISCHLEPRPPPTPCASQRMKFF